MAAVSNKGLALQYASSNLRSDKKVVLAAVHNNAYSLNWVSDRLIKDKEVYLGALRQNPNASSQIPNSILLEWDVKSLPRSTREVVYMWFKQNEEDIFLLAKAKKHFSA